MALSRILPALAIASIATTAVVSAQNPQMLVFGHRYDHESLDANAGDLGKFGAFDAAAVVPGANATAFMFLPGTGLNTVIGDIDGDGKRANFAGQMDSDPRDSLIYFMKHSDKANPRSSNLFFTVSEIYTTNASRPAAEQVTVLKGGKPYVLKNGDFVRIKPGGEAEFFITEDLLFKACGVNQTGSFAKGANALVQDKDGSLYFAPNKGGIRMMGQNGLYVYDGGICYIAAKDITYDADGNVSDVTADSARVVYNELDTTNPTYHTVRSMIVNSNFANAAGSNGGTTTYMMGLEIDPQGGTFTNQYDTSLTHPHLIFYVEFATWSASQPSGTIFSTRDYNNVPGDIAMINGQLMGQRLPGTADASWLGLKATTNVSGKGPQLRGLILTDATGLQSTAPHGVPALMTSNSGVIDFNTSRQADFSFQGPVRNFPMATYFDLAADKGQAPLGANVSGLFQGHGIWSTLRLGPYLSIAPSVTGPDGRASLQLTMPNDPGFIGTGLIFQAIYLTPGSWYLSNPTIADIQ